jgi:hypothetical protein
MSCLFEEFFTSELAFQFCNKFLILTWYKQPTHLKMFYPSPIIILSHKIFAMSCLFEEFFMSKLAFQFCSKFLILTWYNRFAHLKMFYSSLIIILSHKKLGISLWLTLVSPNLQDPIQKIIHTINIVTMQNQNIRFLK